MIEPGGNLSLPEEGKRPGNQNSCSNTLKKEKNEELLRKGGKARPLVGMKEQERTAVGEGYY